MNLEKINTARTQEYVQAIYSKRAVFSNYFGQTFETNDTYLETNDTFILAKQIRDFYRIYAASNNRKELIEILSYLEGTNVINFPTKGGIREIEAIMTESGYKQIGVYERFGYNVKNLTGNEVVPEIEFAKVGDEEAIYNLYSEWKDFNPYTDWLPTHEELNEFIKNKSVIINKQNDKITGVNICPITSGILYLRLIIDFGGGGMKLMNAMFNTARKNGIKRCQWWVNSQNERAIGFYKKLGAIPDGLKDYTYIKK
jgi:hypothetical protein